MVGLWFFPGTPVSTTKTGRHGIAEILLKVALNTKNQIKSYLQAVKNPVTIEILTEHCDSSIHSR